MNTHASVIDRALFWLSRTLGALLLLTCAVSLVSLALTRESNPVAAGERVGWTVLGAATLIPIGIGFLAIANLFRNHSRYRWPAFAIPLVLALVALVLGSRGAHL